MEKFFSVIICLGLALLFLKMSNTGASNIKVIKENEHIREISLKQLALHESLEVKKWVKIQGKPIINLSSKKDYIILADFDNGLGIFVKRANSKINLEQSNIVTIKGLAKEVEKAPIDVKNEELQKIKVANVVIDENSSPPGWWGSWGKAIIGLFLFLITLGTAFGCARNS